MNKLEKIMYHMAGHGVIEALTDTLRENDPAFAEAEKAYHGKNLPEALILGLETLEDYFLHLECAGPKLAHYAGYVIANHLLPWVEPGYRTDWFQTKCFRDDLLRYMEYLPLS